MPLNLRALVLCADDFGQSAVIDRGILALLAQGRLNAVSCMANGPHWAEGVRQLRAVPAVAQGKVSVGLHLNLTEFAPVSAALLRRWPRWPTLHNLILRAHLGALPHQALGEELQAQWDRFIDAFGREPMHLDGHQHVHHLPGVRHWVLARRRTTQGLQLRATGNLLGPGHGLKRWLIEATGGRRLNAALQREAIAPLMPLLGAYDFQEPDYRRLMQQWLRRIPATGALLFCHPALGTDGSGDAIAAARTREYAYLGSPAFAEDLQAAGVHLAFGPGSGAAR